MDGVNTYVPDQHSKCLVFVHRLPHRAVLLCVLQVEEGFVLSWFPVVGRPVHPLSIAEAEAFGIS